MQVLCEAVYQLEEAKTALFKSILLQMSPSNPISIFSNDLYLRVNFLTAVVLAQIQPNATNMGSRLRADFHSRIKSSPYT